MTPEHAMGYAFAALIAAAAFLVFMITLVVIGDKLVDLAKQFQFVTRRDRRRV